MVDERENYWREVNERFRRCEEEERQAMERALSILKFVDEWVKLSGKPAYLEIVEKQGGD